MAVDTPPLHVATPQPAAPAKERAPSRRTLAAVLIPVALVLVAGGLRFYGLGYPPRIYFDETYYATQAQEIVESGVEEGFAVHPPAGKWLISIGVRLFGFSPFGYRFASAVAGTALVAVTYFIALRLFRRRGTAALAALLVAVDGLVFTMSRIAMLDIFLALFVAVGAWLMLVDRDRQWAGVGSRRPENVGVVTPRRSRWARWLAGVAFGLALATKWSAVLAIGGAVAIALVSDALWSWRTTGSVWTSWWRSAGSTALALIVVPVVVYVLSYAGWFSSYELTRLGRDECPATQCVKTFPDIAGAWWGEQVAIATFHRGLEVNHPYRSNALSWPVLQRPVAYYYESCTEEKLAKGECVTEQGNVEEILGIGNPAIWWLALAAYPAVAIIGVLRRDWRALYILGLFLVQYLPWLVIQGGWLGVPRPNFLFYLTPAVAFMCLALAYVSDYLARSRLLNWIPIAVAALVVSAFLFWYPVYVGQELTTGAWKLRIWLRSWV